ncbi:hypothetical protein [Micromonospora thermarum]|uniref:Uncharacterized protein n=1 Tax=Micromonospora thermarum TaxID=2720024 RepID=A0ABX0Z675_9ACTN|nr:hypothetical protein [Micromonospora thermarum]NJP33357.1 hypothetical protein [Micromonospora thermarum]
MKAFIGLLRRLARWLFPSVPVTSGTGQRIQAREQEAARQRLLGQARKTSQRSGTDGEPADRMPTARSVERGA